jgi:vitamin K-dependent gamma-carboxylase-like protein
MSLVRRWQAFWFPAVPVQRLAAFRIVMTGFALADMWFVSGFISRYSRVDDEFYRPLLVLRPLPRLGPDLTTAIHVVLCATLALALVGLFTRLALLIAAPLYLWWWATYYSFGAIHHGRIPIVIALFVMAVAPAGPAYSLDSLLARRWAARAGASVAAREERDELAGWALRVMMVVVVAAYMLAAYAKLARSGVGWVTGGAVEGIMLENQVPAALLVLRHTWAVHAMAALTLVLEGTAWLLFLRGRVRDAYVSFAVLFHVGTLIVLNINFLGLTLAYLAFYDLEVGTARLAAWLRPRVGEEVPVPQ